MAELRPGEVLAGYVIERRIGAGGSGEVYVARHPRLPRLTAIKVLNRAALSGGEDAWRRFEREADITARFDHPNIASVYDRGVDDGRLWISMQYIEGGDVADLLGIDPDRALRIGAEIAAALDYAHGKGVLHRDVKPSNILLAAPDDGRPERALLTDFGIARLHDDTANPTRTGDFSATFAYASPEQLSAGRLTPRSDQYSLACSVFVILTGRRPFDAPHPAAWIWAHMNNRPRRVTEARPDLSPALDAVFDRALAKQPADRFSTCAEFLDAARRAISEVAVAPPIPLGAPAAVMPSLLAPAPVATSVWPPDEATHTMAQPSPTPGSFWAGPGPDAQRPEPVAATRNSGKRWRLGAFAAVVVVVLAAAATFALTRDRSDSDRSRGVEVSVEVTDTRNAPTGDSWGPDHAPIGAAFPRLVGELGADGKAIGWQGASCRILDPGTQDIATTQGARRIVCNPDDTSGRVRFDVIDFGDREFGSGAEVFFDGQGTVSRLTHPDANRDLYVTSDEAVYRATSKDSDARPVYVVVGFPVGDARERFLLVVRWPDHTVDEIQSWLAKVPLQ